MTSDSRETVPDASIHASQARRPKPYIDWFFGCILFSLISIVIGLALFEESGVECFLCREDIGWALVIFAYATPGFAMGSVIWAIMWIRRSWRESKPEQFKPTFVVLLVATTLLVANIHYFYSIPAAKNNLNFNPELVKSIVKVSSIVNPYPHPDEPQGEGHGSGIVIDSQRGWIVTNAHVARRVSSELSFQFSADPDEYSYPAKKLYVDPYLDLAILEGSGAKFPPRVQSVPLECDGKSEMKLMAMGYAGGRRSRFMIVKGERLGTEVWNGKTWFKALANYQRGMSGGPTLNGQSGRVVGINTLGTSGYWDDEVGFTIPARYVCRIVDLLRKGVDPTPPQMPLAFYDNLSSDGELVVAESDQSTSQTSLAEGDMILGVEGIEDSISSESDLVDVLRGVSYPINLRIVRDGTEQLVPVSFSRMKIRPRRDLLYVAGFVVGESTPSNRSPDSAKQELMIRLADSPDIGDAEYHSFDTYTSYIIMNVDGIVFDDIQSIHRHLSGAQRTNQKAVFKLREWRWKAGVRHAYQRLAITPNDLRFIQ